MNFQEEEDHTSSEDDLDDDDDEDWEINSEDEDMLSAEQAENENLYNLG